MEGAINGVKAIAVSMFTVAYEAPLHFETATRWLSEELEALIKLDLPERTFLNINIPAVDYQEIRGTRYTKMGGRVYQDRVEERQDPWGRSYFWQGGIAILKPDEAGSDIEAVSQGFVSVTPVSLDWTNSKYLAELRENTATLKT